MKERGRSQPEAVSDQVAVILDEVQHGCELTVDQNAPALGLELHQQAV